MEYIDEPVTEISSIFDQDHDEIYLDFKISDTGLGVKKRDLIRCLSLMIRMRDQT